LEKSILKIVRGFRAVDGAGVRLVRVLGHDDVYDFDPFLMLDSFDSTDPQDYLAGFPTHPHRGIETITYLISGRIEHEDSLGNGGVIHGGESQWMTAGGGILHQEMPKASDRMLGFQLWLNMPAAEKMAPPAYLDIRQDMMPAVAEDGAIVRVIAGEYKGGGAPPPTSGRRSTTWRWRRAGRSGWRPRRGRRCSSLPSRATRSSPARPCGKSPPC
jgi:redox-sensitive bicupin YhaK (pirin superfamily)